MIHRNLDVPKAGTKSEWQHNRYCLGGPHGGTITTYVFPAWWSPRRGRDQNGCISLATLGAHMYRKGKIAVLLVHKAVRKSN